MAAPTSIRSGLNHIGLTVTDLDASVAFYVDVVGMTFLHRGYQTGGEWFDTLTHNSGAVIDAANVGYEGFRLQLVKYLEGAGGAAETGHNRIGNLHLCIDVPDVEAKHAEITASGRWNPTPIVTIAQTPHRSFYVEDPDGVPVEFLQRGDA
jgi:catechol 2,3-dioxygenase-like lactoylglutathione lyase family enzyme